MHFLIMPMIDKRTYTFYSLGRLLFDEALLVAATLWVLPEFGISLPVWLLITLIVSWAVYSFVISNLVTKVIDRTSAVGPETLIGLKCKTTTPLIPDGHVRVGMEIWQAHSVSGDIDTGTEVIIVNINRLSLFVRPSTDSQQIC
jgi:membrane-bound ClpP family serine protease